MDNFKITTNDLLKRQAGPPIGEQQDQGSSLASDCWAWAGDHKVAIGTTIGIVALAAGSIAATRFLSGRLAQGTEAAAASALELGANASKSVADATLTRTTAPVFSGLAARLERPYAIVRPIARPILPVPTTHCFTQADVEAMFAKLAAARPAAAVGGTSAYEQLIQDLARAGKLPSPFAVLEGAPLASGSQKMTAAEWIMHATHDGGAFHAGPIEDDLLRDLLGVDPRPGTRGFFEETLRNMRRSENDPASTFSRFMPGLRFEMPALSVRPKWMG